MLAEEKIERHTPLGAEVSEACVSSEMCAEASKPVIVYCVSRKPSGSTYHQNMLLLKPELLMRSVKTVLKLAWLSGTTTRMPMITATPRTCHHTEMPLNLATRWLPRMLMSTCSARMIANRTKVSRNPCRESPKLSPSRLTL